MVHRNLFFEKKKVEKPRKKLNTKWNPLEFVENKEVKSKKIVTKKHTHTHKR